MYVTRIYSHRVSSTHPRICSDASEPLALSEMDAAEVVS